MAVEVVKNRIYFMENTVSNIENMLKKLSHNSKENITLKWWAKL